MNFIIEILSKKEKSNEFVFVVRAQNGFPISVCDSLDCAKDVIAAKFEELRKQSNSNN